MVTKTRAIVLHMNDLMATSKSATSVLIVVVDLELSLEWDETVCVSSPGFIWQESIN